VIGVLILFAVIVTTIWVGIDSSRHDWNAGGATAGWVIGCLALWIVFFPVYLYKRTKVPLKGQPGLATATGYEYRECPFCKEAMRRSAEVCPHCRNPSPAWHYHDGRWWFHAHENDPWQWLAALTFEWNRLSLSGVADCCSRQA
jgi:hypothetical protein